MRPDTKKSLARLHQQAVWLDAAVLLERIAGLDLDAVWCRGAARMEDGTVTTPEDPRACRYCADSLIDLKSGSGPVARAAGRALAANLPYLPDSQPWKIRGDTEIWHWNDLEHRQPYQVRRAFRLAAGRALQLAELAS
jgi:hypothetical protein